MNRKAVVKCEAMIVVMTEKYIKSDWCKSELFMAKQEDKVIISCLYEEVKNRSVDVNYAIGDESNLVSFVGGLEGEAFYNNSQKVIDLLKENDVPTDEQKTNTGAGPNPKKPKKKLKKKENSQIELSIPANTEEYVLQRMELLVQRLDALQASRNSVCSSCSIM